MHEIAFVHLAVKPNARTKLLLFTYIAFFKTNFDVSFGLWAGEPKTGTKGRQGMRIKTRRT